MYEITTRFNTRGGVAGDEVWNALSAFGRMMVPGPDGGMVEVTYLEYYQRYLAPKRKGGKDEEEDD